MFQDLIVLCAKWSLRRKSIDLWLFVINKGEKFHIWKISYSLTFTLSGCCSTSQVQEAGSLQPWKVWTSPLIQVVIGQKKMIENSARGTIMMAKETTGSLQFREVVKGNFLNFWSFDWNLYLQQVRQCKQHSTTHENTNVQSIEITTITWATSHFHWKESQQEGLARPLHHLCRFLYLCIKRCTFPIWTWTRTW